MVKRMYSMYERLKTDGAREAFKGCAVGTRVTVSGLAGPKPSLNCAVSTGGRTSGR